MPVWALYVPAGLAIGLATVEAALPKLARRRHSQFEKRDLCIPAKLYDVMRDQARISGWHMDPRPDGQCHETQQTFFPWHSRSYKLTCRLCGRHRTIVHGLRWWPVR